MKKSTLFLVVLLLNLNIYSQYIEGTILNATTHKPIEGVHVYIDDVEEGTISISNGKYFLKTKNTKEIKSNINFSHVGYKNIKIPFHKNQREYNVYLEKDVTSLDVIAINQKRNLKQTISFKKLKPMKKGLFSFGAVLNNNKIYVAGGNGSYLVDGLAMAFDKYDDTDLTIIEKAVKSRYSSSAELYRGDFLIYDIPTDTWTENKSKFDKRANHNANLFGENLYVLGGKKLAINKKKEYLSTNIEIINLKTGTKIIDETNPHQAVDFVSFNYQGNLIVAGGSTKIDRNGKKEYTNKVHFYDLNEGYWYELDTMPTAKETNGVLIDDKIYLIGGSNNKPLSEIESFDLITKKWKKEGNLFFGIESPAVSSGNDIIYVYDNDKIYTYNTKNKELKEFYIKLSLTCSKMYFSNNKLYLLGGKIVNKFEITPSPRLYSIDISEFNKTQIVRTKTL